MSPHSPEEGALERPSPEPVSIGLRGNFAGQIKVIPSTMMNLRIAVGETEDARPLLVPFVELRMSELNPGEETEEPRVFFSAILSMDNAAFLMADLAGDLLVACQHFSAIAESSIKPDNARTALTRSLIEKAAATLADCAATLQKAEAKAEPEAT